MRSFPVVLFYAERVNKALMPEMSVCIGFYPIKKADFKPAFKLSIIDSER